MSEIQQTPEVGNILRELGVEASESRSILEQNKKEASQTLELGGLHGDRAPEGRLLIQKEKPIHRIMGLMVAKGATYREIAAATGYTPIQVSTIIRQPWMRTLVLKLIEDEGLDPVKTLISSAGIDSIYKLIELRDSAPPNVALGATKELMDRLLGKASQTIVHEKRMPEDPVSEKARLEREITEMQKRLSETVTPSAPPRSDTTPPQ